MYKKTEIQPVRYRKKAWRQQRTRSAKNIHKINTQKIFVANMNFRIGGMRSLLSEV